jgi:hypothetical protein
MLMSSLMDRETHPPSKSRKQKPHYDLFARVFGDMKPTVPSAGGGNTSAVSKTMNFFRKAVTTTGIAIEMPSDVPWFLYQRSKREHKVLTADDILLTFSQWSSEDGGQECPLHLLSVHSISSALLDIGRQVISSPTKPQLDLDTSLPSPTGQFMIVQVVEARGLRNSELVGKSSPYVTIQLIRSGSRYRSASAASVAADGEDEDSPLRQTRVIHHKLNPHFGESFRFTPADLAGLQIEVKVWSWSRYFRHSLLGAKTINISGISSSRYEDFWVDMEMPRGANPGGGAASAHAGNANAVAAEGETISLAGDGSGNGRVHLIITLPKKSDLLE